MGYLPIFLELAARPCVVVGGGVVAARKVEALLAAGAAVTVVSPTLAATLKARAKRRELRHLERNYETGDLRGFALVFEATGDPAVACAVAREAGAEGIPVNVADVPALCTFIAPSVIKRGALQIAVSTGGASPAYARMLRAEFEATLGHEHELILEILSAARRHIRLLEPDAEARGKKLTALVACGLREYIRRGDYATADAALLEHIGAGFSDLGIDIAGLAQAGAPPPKLNES